MSTLVCAPIMVREPAAASRDAAVAGELGADILELRLDELFSDPPDGSALAAARGIIRSSPLPCIATCRAAGEGGAYEGDDGRRLEWLAELAQGEDRPRYIDVEFASYAASGRARALVDAVVRRPGDGEESAGRPALILSAHGMEGPPADLSRLLLKMRAEPAAGVLKVAFRARSLRDNLELFDTLKQRDRPTIALGMGRFGLMSRVLAPKFGGFLTFASLRPEGATAPGQPTVGELLELYRFRSIGPGTKVYGVIGWPVEQSLSPLVHSAGFAEVGHDGVYLPMPVAADPGDPEGTYASFKATVQTLLDDDSINFCGASVTIPFKTCLARYGSGLQDERDEAFRIVCGSGAANTLVVDRNDVSPGMFLYYGHALANTDAGAIRGLLEDAVGPLPRRQIVILGTGGAARSGAFACADAGARVVVAGRSRERAERVAEELSPHFGQGWEGSVRAATLDAAAQMRADAIVNCTPVGMAGGPDPHGIPVPIERMTGIGPETVVFDTVYNPPQTPLIRAARERGCRVIDGVSMFVRQAAAQFGLWTGKAPPVELFERLVRSGK